MAGNLLSRARRDADKIILSGGFEENITLRSPDNPPVTLETTSLESKHWISFDDVGNQVNSKSVKVFLSEEDLIQNSYPYRVSEEVYLMDHLVSLPDSSGIVKNYVIKEWYPDETIGIITCILKDYVD